MIKKSIIVLISLSTFIPVSLFSQEPSVELTLDECIALALRQNPLILSTLEQYQAFLARVNQAKAFAQPSLDYDNDMQPKFFNLKDTGETYFGVSQSLEFPGKRILRGKIATKESEEILRDIDLLKLDIVFLVKEAFCGLLLAQEKLQYAEQDQQLAQDFLQKAELKYSAGDVAKVEALRARVESSKAANEVRSASNDVRLAKAMLNFLLARKKYAPLEIQGDLKKASISLNEDELISYTLHNFREDGDYTWPLLFPMVKSVVRAMDAVQEFSAGNLGHPVDRFVVTGASKRGWTTWLTGSRDERICAIAPMVIDVLNMSVSLDYQVKVWGDYSIQIEDYVNLGIPQAVHSDTGRAITAMIDPYSYRESLTMPKMIFIGTNDEYWPVDAIRHYLEGIPGENFIHYVPNAGHGLGDGEQAIRALSAFFGRSLSGGPYPVCNWDVTPSEKDLLLSVEASAEELLGAILWRADSEDRDFRDETFSGTGIEAVPAGNIQVAVEFPVSGYRAFYLDLIYSDPNGGEYSKSTRMFVTDTEKILDD